DDTIKIGTQLTNGDVFNGGTGNSELDVVAPDGGTAMSPVAISVSKGILTVGNVTLNQGGTITAAHGVTVTMSNFQTFKAIGGSGDNQFFTDGSFPNVVLQGGSGNNTLSAKIASTGTAELIGGSGPNDLIASGGTVKLIGGSGPNTFDLVGPGHYTV